MAVNGFFITGTDTGIGKTVVSAWLAWHLKAAYWKPVQTGHPPDSDTQTVKQLAGAVIFPETAVFSAPLSAYHAAVNEGQELTLEMFSLPKTNDPLLVESAGGLLAPLNATQTMADLAKHLELPLLIVARSTLGTINHTCLTVEAARQRRLKVAGAILNGPENQLNAKAIEQFAQLPVLAHLPSLECLKDMQDIPVPEKLRSLFLSHELAAA